MTPGWPAPPGCSTASPVRWWPAGCAGGAGHRSQQNQGVGSRAVPVGEDMAGHQYVVEAELLGPACCIQGQGAVVRGEGRFDGDAEFHEMLQTAGQSSSCSGGRGLTVGQRFVGPAEVENQVGEVAYQGVRALGGPCQPY